MDTVAVRCGQECVLYKMQVAWGCCYGPKLKEEGPGQPLVSEVDTLRLPSQLSSSSSSGLEAWIEMAPPAVARPQRRALGEA